MNSSAATLGEKHGGKITYGGELVHSFYDLLSPDDHFAAHPEYFAQFDGERVREHTQLCCTNEDVVRLVVARVHRLMTEQPQATVFSISQMDWDNYCCCPDCAALAEKEDTLFAPVLYLVNRVVAALAAEFPAKVIDTIAYEWSRRPPKTMRPLPNVIVRLCSVECCFSHPLATWVGLHLIVVTL